MHKYVDLLITNNDLLLDSGNEPKLVFDRDCIVQDIKHLVRDSGLMVEVIGQRDDNRVQQLLLDLTLMIEDDVRLIPGTVLITETDLGEFYVTADSYEFGSISLRVTA